MTVQTPRFGTVITAMVTPFAESGQLDLEAAATLAGWLVDTGSDGLVLAGSTGESPTLTLSEEDALTKAVRASVDVPILLGVGSNDTAYAVSSTRRAAELGVDGVLVVSPYYNRPSQSGIDAYYRSVAAATDLPVVIYDVPARTGRGIALATILRLVHEVDNIVAVKDAAGDVARAATMIRDCPDDFELYAGDDALTLPLFSVGAVGTISVASHWAAHQIASMIAAHRAGDTATAVAINQQLIASYEFESHDEAPNPVPAKAMLRVLGHKVGHPRSPMGPDPDWLEPLARELLASLG